MTRTVVRKLAALPRAQVRGEQATRSSVRSLSCVQRSFPLLRSGKYLLRPLASSPAALPRLRPNTVAAIVAAE
eukprot:4058207-Pleurochrysis_carterae.AAC.1